MDGEIEFEITDFISNISDESPLFPNNVIQDPRLPPCRIVNVVCTCSLGVRINLPKLALELRDKMPCKYKPQQFAAMMISIKAPGVLQATVLLFGTSKMVAVGCKSEEHARLIAWLFCSFLNKHLGIKAFVHDFEIRNIVSCFNIGHPIDLEGLTNEVGARATYDPELIKSCRIRDLFQPRQVGIVYPTGNMVITGPKKRSHILRIYKWLYELCRKYKTDKDMSKYKDSGVSKTRGVTKEKMREISRKLANMEKKDIVLGPNTKSIPYMSPLKPEISSKYANRMTSFSSVLAEHDTSDTNAPHYNFDSSISSPINKHDED